MIIGKNGKVTIHPEKHALNVPKYKEELWKCIGPLLEVYGLVEIELEKLKMNYQNEREKTFLENFLINKKEVKSKGRLKNGGIRHNIILYYSVSYY